MCEISQHSRVPTGQDEPVTQTTDSPQAQLALAITDEVRRRYPADVMAVGAYGPLAHSDERERTDLNLVVVTYRPETGPLSTARQFDETLVELTVVTAQSYLDQASSITARWPLLADRYLCAIPLYDEVGWHRRLRDTHLARLAQAVGGEFTALAGQAWCRAASYFRRAQRYSERFDGDGALLVLAQARIAAAITEGLLTRTYFHSEVDAARRTALVGADLQSVSARLDAHAEELAKRGRPVDGTVSDLLLSNESAQ